MRLFAVHNIHTGKFALHSGKPALIPGKKGTRFTTDNKQLCKEVRDELNGGLCDERPVKGGKHWAADRGWRVTLGPDHWRYAHAEN